MEAKRYLLLLERSGFHGARASLRVGTERREWVCSYEGFRRGKERSLQAATAAVRCSHRIASSICFGEMPYSEARSGTDSRALNLEETTAVEMPVPAITGLPKPTAGLIRISLGSFAVRSMTNG